MTIFNLQFSIFNSRKSFTLVELLIVIGIIGILALIGVPTFRVFQPNLQLSGDVRNLVTDLRYAGQLAVTEQIDYGVKFFLDTNQYQIIRHGGTSEIIKSESLSSGVSFQEIAGFGGEAEAVFNPYGAARETGTITLVNIKNSISTIDVRPSGFIKIIKQ